MGRSSDEALEQAIYDQFEKEIEEKLPYLAVHWGNAVIAKKLPTGTWDEVLEVYSSCVHDFDAPVEPLWIVCYAVIAYRDGATFDSSYAAHLIEYGEHPEKPLW